MRTFVIGDIHGQRLALESLVKAIPLSDEDRLIFLGDYVDKGPDVKGTLECLSRLSSWENTIFLRGNHDQMLIDAYRDPEKFGIWECLAGDDPLASYGTGDSYQLIHEMPPHHWRFLEDACVDYFETEDFIFVHAGIRADRNPGKEEIERLQWMTLSMAEPHQSGKIVVCGHTRSESGRIVDLGHTICIDTGISKNGFLTCLEMETFGFWQADSQGMISTGALRRGS